MDERRPKTPDAHATANAITNPGTGTPETGSGQDRKGPSDTEAPPTLSQIRYPCLMNMDYHGTREAWLDQIHRWLMFGVIVAGATAFIDAWPSMKLLGPIMAVVCGSLDLTFDLSNRARLHAMFRRRYSEILSEATMSPDKLIVLRCKLDELSGEEEPPFHAQLALSAIKGQQATYGEITQPCRPPLLFRILANVLRFDGHDFNN